MKVEHTVPQLQGLMEDPTVAQAFQNYLIAEQFAAAFHWMVAIILLFVTVYNARASHRAYFNVQEGRAQAQFVVALVAGLVCICACAGGADHIYNLFAPEVGFVKHILGN